MVTNRKKIIDWNFDFSPFRIISYIYSMVMRIFIFLCVGIMKKKVWFFLSVKKYSMMMMTKMIGESITYRFFFFGLVWFLVRFLADLKKIEISWQYFVVFFYFAVRLLKRSITKTLCCLVWLGSVWILCFFLSLSQT